MLARDPVAFASISNLVRFGLRLVGAGCLLGAGGWLAAPAHAGFGTLAAVAVDTDTAPGTGGGSYQGFLFYPSISKIGTAAFGAGVLGGTTLSGVFSEENGVDAAIALEGDSAPGTGGGVFSQFGGTGCLYGCFATAINGGGLVAFGASVTGGTASEGIFRGSAMVTAAAVEGGSAPGTGSGTYSAFVGPAINNGGDVAFVASVTSGISPQGIFVDLMDSGDAMVALVGDAAPGTGGGDFNFFYAPSIDDSGDVVFPADILGGLTTSGIFRAASGGISAVAVVGDVAPGTGGGAYTSIAAPRISNTGRTVFSASVNLTGENSIGGVFLDENGIQSAVALAGQTAPGTGGGTYSGFTSPDVSDDGKVIFHATVAGSSITEGIFVAYGNFHRAIALEGDPAPGTGGGVFTDFFFAPKIEEAQGIFWASMSGGSSPSGVFRVDLPATAVPAVSGQGLGLVALMLLAAGALLLGKGRSRRPTSIRPRVAAWMRP
jgi:hypothetical protein